MTDKVQKIREEVERLKSNLIYGACSSQIAMETMCKEEAYNEVLAILDTMKEQHVSEELETFAKKESEAFAEREYEIGYIDRNALGKGCYWGCIDGAKWNKEQMMAKAIDGIARPDDDEVWCDLKSFNFKNGDKVKVIVIKED